MELTDSFSHRLKKLRLFHNLTQNEVASKVLVSRQAVSNWENDKNLPDLGSIILLCNLYEVSIDDLLNSL